jgi:hypothetical protein
MTSLISMSPSWRKALALERLTSDRSDPSVHSQPAPRAFFYNWNSQSSTSVRGRSFRESTDRGTSRSPKPYTPFLTVALVRLSEVFPEFERLLLHPTYDQVAQACALLDASVATAGSPATSPAASPKHQTQQQSRAPSNSKVSSHHRSSSAAAATTTTRRSTSALAAIAKLANASNSSSPQRHRSGLLPASPPSPLFPWLKRGLVELHSYPNIRLSNSQPTSSALALEGEWEHYVSPLLLVTAAEVVYHDMHHLSSVQHTVALPALYRRIARDIRQTQQALCTPLLSTVAAPRVDDIHEPSSPPRIHSHEGVARHVSRALDDWHALCLGRARLIDIQTSLWWGGHSSVPSTNTTETKEPANATSPHEADSYTGILSVERTPAEAALEKTHESAPGRGDRILVARQAIADMWQSIETQETHESEMLAQSSSLVRKSWTDHVHLWKVLLEAAASLEQCRYVQHLFVSVH